MNVLLVSQCDKRALRESRRILDQFAERRGERTWQTPITQAGLDTLRKLLRKTARKNTAVACHWIRGQDHSELMWIVGDHRRFNPEGAVPTNTTARNVLRSGDENDWHTAQDIRLLAQLAALLHDLGKASVAFQERLKGKRTERNLYRHEWVSLRLFLAFVGDDDDEGWLTRMTGEGDTDETDWIAPGRYLRDGLDNTIDRYPFRDLTARAPLAAAIGWLVVTHHRLPVVPVKQDDGSQAWLGKRAARFEQAWLTTPLAHMAHDWNEVDPHATPADAKPYWKLDGPLPVVEPAWRKQAARLAQNLRRRRLQHNHSWLDDPYVMHLARLSLMLADHYYSSLPKASPLRARGGGHTRLYANTAPDGSMKQPLDEHLIGVARDAGFIAHALPGFEQHLPRLANHKGLRKRSADKRFAWQDKTFDAAVGMREAARERGAFIVDMASTGCGKTLANARILYALADPQLGLRATYALGLRTLTLQTGRTYRHDLHLAEDELAVLVGGAASRALFRYYQGQAEMHGSASAQALIEEDSHVLYEGNVADHPLLSRALADPNIKKLLSAPLLVCTVDHLAPATEGLRAGRQFAPMLRLLSADLVLDELDDYGLDDLPALTRLVYWSGLLGTRVVLSSATLSPALVTGMYLAYRAGRQHYRRNRGLQRADAPLDIPCLWADEFGVQREDCATGTAFDDAHARFVARRVAQLQATAPLRRAELLPITIATHTRESIRTAFAHEVRAACLRLHAAHADVDPVTGRRTSFGLVRMANIDPLFDVARMLYAQGVADGYRIHLCVYHARFPLAQRSAIEFLLDRVFDRRDPVTVWRDASVRAALDRHPEDQHLFVVLASPVCEVGRDWDADWAVAEPSSMRSLIQLAGRVQRHRRKPPTEPNLLVLDTNLRHFEHPGKPAFVRPGFEVLNPDTDGPRFQLTTHQLTELLAPAEYETVSAIPRIQPRPAPEWQVQTHLTDLEQARIAYAMLPRRRRGSDEVTKLPRDQAFAGWKHPRAALTGVLPQQQPFREETASDTTLAFLPDEDEERLVPHRVEKTTKARDPDVYVPATDLLGTIDLATGPRIDRWGNFDLLQLIVDQANALDEPLPAVARKFATVQAPRVSDGKHWRWHPWLGITRGR